MITLDGICAPCRNSNPRTEAILSDVVGHSVLTVTIPVGHLPYYRIASASYFGFFARLSFETTLSNLEVAELRSMFSLRLSSLILALASTAESYKILDGENLSFVDSMNVFTGRGRIESPLTLDHSELKKFIS